MDKRRFSNTQRRALYFMADGKGEQCGMARRMNHMEET